MKFQMTNDEWFFGAGLNRALVIRHSSFIIFNNDR